MLCPYAGLKTHKLKIHAHLKMAHLFAGDANVGACGARFTTFERVQLREISVLKRDGRKVPFNREKTGTVLQYCVTQTLSS